MRNNIRFLRARAGFSPPVVISPLPPSPPPSPPPPPPPADRTQAVTVKTTANRVPLVDLIPELANYPADNTLTISRTNTTNGKLQLTRGPIFEHNPVLMSGPGASWDGTEGTGWADYPGGARPSQAAGIAPKARIATWAHQRFPGYIDLVAVASDELSGGRWAVEGQYIDLLPSDQQFVYETAPDGSRRWVYGYAVRVFAADWTGLGTDNTRGIEAIFIGTPTDGTMTPVVLGAGSSRAASHTFYPATTANGAIVELKPSVGSTQWDNYTTPGVDREAVFADYNTAILYVIGVTNHGIKGTKCPGANCAPLMTIKENCTIEMANGSFGTDNGARGFIEIKHDPAVTAVVWNKTGISGTALWYPGTIGITWIGAAHSFDWTHCSGFSTSPSGTDDRYWYRANGIGRHICDWDMFDHLDDSRQPRNVEAFLQAKNCDWLYWDIADKSLSTTGVPFVGAERVNCTRRDLSANDTDNGTWFTYNDRIIRATALPHRVLRAAFSVVHTLGASPPKLVKTGNNGDGTIQWKTSANVNIGALFDLTAYTTTRTLVTAMMADSAIAAVMTITSDIVTADDRIKDRAAWYLDNGGREQGQTPQVDVVGGDTGSGYNQGAWTQTINSGSASTPFFTFIDVHMDDWQAHGTTAANIVRVNKRVFGSIGIQFPFYDVKATRHLDCNHFIDNDVQQMGAAQVVGQVGGVVNWSLLNYSNPRDRLQLGSGVSGDDWLWDDLTHGKISSICVDKLTYKSNLASAFPVITNSYFGTSASQPSPAVTDASNRIGLGDWTVCYPGLASMDPRPAGPLIDPANMITPQWPHDAWGVEASTTVPIGAKYQEPTFTTCTGSEGKQLAVVALGDDTCTFTISGHMSAGDTGEVRTYTANVTGIEV